MGDLHLKDDVMSAFMEARSQMKVLDCVDMVLVLQSRHIETWLPWSRHSVNWINLQDVLQSNEGSEQMVVQLGDVGTGPTSGSPAAFEKAREFLTGFDVPFRVITGTWYFYGSLGQSLTCAEVR